ncbi:TonB-dependent receptor [Methylosinus sp. PW1]|uniref:TonB-dependent receptor n=1 Tax=Methylosinus sp. PW1 TaxID=107636 RepID=UPI000562DB97|nr:TonB-dependent receptor [Methylosinus sp. PW1]
MGPFRHGEAFNPLTLSTTQLAVAGAKLLASPRNYGGVTVVESSLGDNANSFILPGYALLNGMIAYTTKIEDLTVTAQLNCRNITDTIYYPTSSNRTTIQTGTPRTFVGSLRVEF